MFDIRWIRDNPDAFDAGLQRRGHPDDRVRRRGERPIATAASASPFLIAGPSLVSVCLMPTYHGWALSGVGATSVVDKRVNLDPASW